MKNNYRKLKLRILLQTLIITLLTSVVGWLILTFLIDGVFQDSFADGVIRFLTGFHISEEQALMIYHVIIRKNKNMYVIIGFFVLFLIFFNVGMSKLTRYLDQVGDGIENILSESTEPIFFAGGDEAIGD